MLVGGVGEFAAAGAELDSGDVREEDPVRGGRASERLSVEAQPGQGVGGGAGDPRVRVRRARHNPLGVDLDAAFERVVDERGESSVCVRGRRADVNGDPAAVRDDVFGGPALNDGGRRGDRPEEGIDVLERERVEGEQVSRRDRQGVHAEVRARGVRRRPARGRGQDQESLLREARPKLGRLADDRGRDVREVRPEHVAPEAFHAVALAAAGFLALGQRDHEPAPGGRSPARLRKAEKRRPHRRAARLGVDGAAAVDRAIDARRREGRVRVVLARRDHVEVRGEEQHVVAVAEPGPDGVSEAPHVEAGAARDAFDEIRGGAFLKAQRWNADEVGVEVENGKQEGCGIGGGGMGARRDAPRGVSDRSGSSVPVAAAYP